MTDKIDIEKLARETVQRIGEHWRKSEELLANAQANCSTPSGMFEPYYAAIADVFSALTALRLEHAAEIARLEAGCSQCRVGHEARVKGLEAEIAALKDSVAEYDNIFALQTAAWERALVAWRAAHPGNELVQPGTEQHFVWLMDEITRLQAVLSGDVMCKSMHYENGKCDLVLSHPIMASIIAEAVNMFDQGGGRNYVSFRTKTEQRGRFEIIIQRCGGKTPAEKNGELTAAVQLALDWRGLDGDGITDPTRQTLMDAIAPKEKGDKR